jgi:hypothetical protein
MYSYIKEFFCKDLLDDINAVVSDITEGKFGLKTCRNVELLWYATDNACVVNGLGSYVECGVYKGSTLVTIAELIRRYSNIPIKMMGLDTFEGFPNDAMSIEDHPEMFERLFQGGLITKEHYNAASDRTQSFKDVSHLQKKYFADVSLESIKDEYKDISFIKTDFANINPSQIGTIGVLHIDCDLYSSYNDVLSSLFDNVSSGGYIIFDEYYSLKYPGPRLAVNEFIKKCGLKLNCALSSDGYQRWWVKK